MHNLYSLIECDFFWFCSTQEAKFLREGRRYRAYLLRDGCISFKLGGCCALALLARVHVHGFGFSPRQNAL